MSAAPNFHAKLSGLGTFVHRNDPALIAYIVDNAIDILGSDHLMFGSNFPIEKLWTSHAELIKAHGGGLGGQDMVRRLGARCLSGKAERAPARNG